MTSAPKFTIFRASEAPTLSQAGAMRTQDSGEVAREGLMKLAEAGLSDGHTVKWLFSTPGFSLAHAWFKSGFPLPRHSHNVDCLYYVVAGSLVVGTNVLGKGDGFFVPRDAPYTYAAGPGGVEVLEFRSTNEFDIRILADNPNFWSRALDTVNVQRDAWANEAPPSEASQSA